LNPVNYGNLGNGFDSNSWIWTIGLAAIRPIGFYKKIFETRDFFIIFWVFDWLQSFVGVINCTFCQAQKILKNLRNTKP
jgi:hypothetical protein